MHNTVLVIPGLSAIASEHRNLTAPYYGSIYILNYNVITQSQGTTVLLLRFSYRHAVYVLFGTVQGAESVIGDWATSKSRNRNQRLEHRDWMERQVFPVADIRCHDSRKSYDRLFCGKDQSGRLIDACFRSYKLCVRGQVFWRKSIVGHLSFCVE